VTTLVLAGTGKTGRRVAARLASLGVPVRAGSRSTVPPFDWEDRRTWRRALEDASAVYVAYAPDLAYPGAATAVGRLAREAGDARRLVLLSRRGEDGAAEAEQALRACDAPWTIVRASAFCQVFSEGHLLGPVRDGEVILPARPVGEPFVDAGDVADVAVTALTEDGHAGRTYEVTGPRLLTFAEAVEEIAEAAGREIRYCRVSMERYEAMLAAQGAPLACVSLLKYLFAEVHDGRNARPACGVQHALGREPRDFADYARATAATGVWEGATVP
jgi:uncharacterized protein YbjT (DUF2867 family)